MAVVIFVSLSLREYNAPTTFIEYCLYSEMRGHVTGLLLLPNNYASMLAVAHARVRYK